MNVPGLMAMLTMELINTPRGRRAGRAAKVWLQHPGQADGDVVAESRASEAACLGGRRTNTDRHGRPLGWECEGWFNQILMSFAGRLGNKA